MTVRGTLVLAATFAGLVAYLLLTSPGPGPRSDARDRLTPPLDAAVAVEIVRGGVTSTFVRRDGAWSTAGVSDLLDALASLEVLGLLDASPTDPGTYGLGADALRLRVRSDEGNLLDLEVGAMNPSETAVYVRRMGHTPVLLVGSLLHWELQKLRRVVSTTSPP